MFSGWNKQDDDTMGFISPRTWRGRLPRKIIPVYGCREFLSRRFSETLRKHPCTGDPVHGCKQKNRYKRRDEAGINA